MKRENEWDECAKSGFIFPLFEKSDKNVSISYSGVDLLSMSSIVLTIVIAKRLFVY